MKNPGLIYRTPRLIFEQNFQGMKSSMTEKSQTGNVTSHARFHVTFEKIIIYI